MAALGFAYAIVGIIVSTIVLWLVAYLFKKNKGFLSPLVIAVVTGMVTYVLGLFNVPLMYTINLAVTVFLGIYLLKTLYKLNWLKTFLIWLVWFLIMAIISFLLNIFTQVSFSAI